MPQSPTHAPPVSRVDGEPLDFPLARTCPFDPPAQYAELRAEQPIVQVRLPDGQLSWLVTRYEDVRKLLMDPRISADRWHPNMPLTEPVTPQGRQAIAAVSQSLIGLDPPEHGRHRELLITEFTVRRVHTLRPYIQQVVDGCIDELLAGPQPADLVEALCLPVPSMVLCELLGVPYEDREFFQHRATMQSRRGVSPQDRGKAGLELRTYIDQLISVKEADPGEDLLGRLIVRDREAQVFDHGQLVGLTTLLMIAGHESTANMLSLSVAGLLEHPDQLAEVTGGGPAAVAKATEELLRYFAIVDTMPRVAKAEIEAGGVTIKEGDGVLFGFASANRDEQAFDDPATMDVRRGARHHVAFGYGIHQCIGQNLARAEMEIVFTSLFARLPGLRLAGELDQLPFKYDSNVYGIDRLTVTW